MQARGRPSRDSGRPAGPAPVAARRLPTAGSVPTRRVAFVTLGQSPRTDLVPDILNALDATIEPVEVGVLDTLSQAQVAQVAPGPDEPALISRLRDGSDVVLAMDWTSSRMGEIYREVADQNVDLVVLMTTMLGDSFAPAAATIFCDRVIERAIDGFVDAGQTVGIVLSLEVQQAQLGCLERVPSLVRCAIALPGDGKALSSAIARLADCDILLLHSVTYSEADRQQARELSGKPVILARQLVVSAIRDALARLGPSGPPVGDDSPFVDPVEGGPRTPLSERLRRLSRREREIMFLVAGGLSNKHIARRLGISHRTVEIHRARMVEKMEFATIAELVRTVDSLTA